MKYYSTGNQIAFENPYPETEEEIRKREDELEFQADVRVHSKIEEADYEGY